MLIHAGGIDVFTKDHGTGPPILLLHGNPDTADIWDKVIHLLQRQHRCIAPDLPGFGRSAALRNFVWLMIGIDQSRVGCNPLLARCLVLAKL